MSHRAGVQRVPQAPSAAIQLPPRNAHATGRSLPSSAATPADSSARKPASDESSTVAAAAAASSNYRRHGRNVAPAHHSTAGLKDTMAAMRVAGGGTGGAGAGVHPSRDGPFPPKAAPRAGAVTGGRAAAAAKVVPDGKTKQQRGRMLRPHATFHQPAQTKSHSLRAAEAVRRPPPPVTVGLHASYMLSRPDVVLPPSPISPSRTASGDAPAGRCNPASFSSAADGARQPAAAPDAAAAHGPVGSMVSGLESSAPFLASLRGHIRQELAALNLRESTADSKSMVQVYRGCLQRMAESFRTYGPLLAEAKQHYDRYISELEHQVQELPVVRARLSTIRQAHATELEAVKASHRREVSRLNADLRRVNMDKMTLESKLQESVQRLEEAQAGAVAMEHRYRDMKTANETIIVAFRRAERTASTLEESETGLRSEVDGMRFLVSSMQSDKNRLEVRLQALKDQMKTMASQAEMASQTAAVAALSRQCLRLHNAHNALAHKYNTLATSAGKPADATPLPDADVADYTAQCESPEPSSRAVQQQTALLQQARAMLLKHLFAALDISRAGSGAGSPTRRVPQLEGTAANLEAAEALVFERIAALRKEAAAASKPGRKEGYGAAAARDNGTDSPEVAYDARGYRMTRQPVAKVVDQDMFFQGQGAGPSVPKYLRVHGLVRNLHLAKRDVELAVRETWMFKKRMESGTWEGELPTSPGASPTRFAMGGADGAGGRAAAADDGSVSGGGAGGSGAGAGGGATSRRVVPLHDAFYAYLLDKYGTPGKAVEIAYNVLDGAERFEYDADLEVFLKVLEGTLSEQVYFRGLTAVQQFVDQLELLDRQLHGGVGTGEIPRQVFAEDLGKFLPNKTDDALEALMTALDLTREGRKANIVYHPLFEEDSNGDQSEFCEALRDQHLQDYLEYLQEISEAVSDMTIGTEVRVDQARQAIRRVDPEKPADAVNVMLCCGCGVPQGTALDDNASVVASLFMRRLASEWQARATRRNKSALLTSRRPAAAAANAS